MEMVGAMRMDSADVDKQMNLALLSFGDSISLT